jgi:hypothetical protein
VPLCETLCKFFFNTQIATEYAQRATEHYMATISGKLPEQEPPNLV